MALFARSYQDLMVDSINDLSLTNITKLSAGGIARALLETSNKRLGEAYQIFDLNMARAFVSAANGEFLDLIGVLLNVTRESSAAANVDTDSEVVKFYVDGATFGSINNGADITLLQGTILSTAVSGGGTTYRTTSQVTLPAGSSSAFVGAEATVTGTASNIGKNSLIYHNFQNYADYLSDTLKVTNLHEVGNGSNLESDANYKYRIVNRVLEAEAANFTAIRLAVLSTSGVAEVVVIPRYRGIGTAGLIIQSTSPTVSQDLLDSVTANTERVKAIGDILYIKKPREIGLGMNLTVHYIQRLTNDEYTQIESNLTTTITNYVNGLDIGETFLVNKLVAELFGVSDRITNFGIAGKPIDEVYIYTESQLADNKTRALLLGDYVAAEDERVIIEPSLATPITYERSFTRR